VPSSGCRAGFFCAFDVLAFVLELPGDMTRGFAFTVAMLLVIVLDARLSVCWDVAILFFDRCHFGLLLGLLLSALITAVSAIAFASVNSALPP
jgi:hypothetical protein